MNRQAVLGTLLSIVLLVACSTNDIVQEETVSPDEGEYVEELFFPGQDVHTITVSILQGLDAPLEGDVSEEQGAELVCYKWYRWHSTRCGEIRTCRVIDYNSDLRPLGNQVARATNSGVQKVCNELGCPVKKFKNPIWYYYCFDEPEPDVLCVLLDIEFVCEESEE